MKEALPEFFNMEISVKQNAVSGFLYNGKRKWYTALHQAKRITVKYKSLELEDCKVPFTRQEVQG